jgi:probable O-glycosylation ligase (exosortase A-associated)
MCFFGRGWRNLGSLQIYLIVILWVWFTITSFVSADSPLFVHHSVDTWSRWQLVSKILLMTVVTAVVVDSFERLRVLLLVVAGCFGFFILKAIPFVITSGGGFRLYGPDNSMIADNNDFGLALNMTLPLFLCLAQTESKRWVRWLSGFTCLATVPMIFFTYSRGALVGLVAVGGILLLRSKNRLLVLPAIVLGLSVAFLFAPPEWRERMDPTRSDAIDGSAMSRINAWTFAWNLAQDYPVMGGGFATFTPELFQRYAPTVNDIHGAHSIYFQVLGEHGFVGLFLYLGLIGSCFLTARGVAKRARQRGDLRVQNYANTLQFCLVGFLASGAFLGRAYFDYFFLLAVCVAVLAKVEWQGADHAEIETFETQSEEELALEDVRGAVEA